NQLYEELCKSRSRLAGETKGHYILQYENFEKIINLQNRIIEKQVNFQENDENLMGDGFWDDLSNVFSDNREKRAIHSELKNEIFYLGNLCNEIQENTHSLSSTIASKKSYLDNLLNPDLFYLGLVNNLAKLQVFLMNLSRKLDACRYGLFYVNQEDSDSIIKFLNYVIVTGSLEYYDYEPLEELLLSFLLVIPGIKFSFSEDIAELNCSEFLKSKLTGKDTRERRLWLSDNIRLVQYNWSSVFRQKVENYALKCLEDKGIQYLNFNCSYDVLIQKETIANLSSLSKLEC
ncbi:MAG: hypothetical protein SAK29_32575, partial [Scytonema sp. PMC 1069.18]|nr:hypothetical protein [Scytonema sp. PMC 1069.18]